MANQWDTSGKRETWYMCYKTVKCRHHVQGRKSDHPKLVIGEEIDYFSIRYGYHALEVMGVVRHTEAFL